MLAFGSMVLVSMAMQGASDTTRASREAYTACLRTYVEHSLGERMALEAFLAAYPQQCLSQQTAYRSSVIARETALRATRGNAETTATEEIDDARLNFRERFEMALPAPPAGAPAAPTAPAAAPAAAGAPAAAPTATTPAAATTPPAPPPPQPR